MRILKPAGVLVIIAMSLMAASANLWFISQVGWNKLSDVTITTVSCNPCSVGEPITFSGGGADNPHFTKFHLGPWLKYYDTPTNHGTSVVISGDTWTSRDPAVFGEPGQYDVILYTMKKGQSVKPDDAAPIPYYVELDRVTITVVP